MENKKCNDNQNPEEHVGYWDTWKPETEEEKKAKATEQPNPEELKGYLDTFDPDKL